MGNQTLIHCQWGCTMIYNLVSRKSIYIVPLSQQSHWEEFPKNTLEIITKPYVKVTVIHSNSIYNKKILEKSMSVTRGLLE
jgi:hypothetical protein